MKANVNINIRTTSELKDNANNVLTRLGLDMSTAVNLFLTQVVDKNAIPFPLTVSSGKKQARLGGWEGRGWIADDFNERQPPKTSKSRLATELKVEFTQR